MGRWISLVLFLIGFIWLATSIYGWRDGYSSSRWLVNRFKTRPAAPLALVTIQRFPSNQQTSIHFKRVASIYSSQLNLESTPYSDDETLKGFRSALFKSPQTTRTPTTNNDQRKDEITSLCDDIQPHLAHDLVDDHLIHSLTAKVSQQSSILTISQCQSIIGVLHRLPGRQPSTTALVSALAKKMVPQTRSGTSVQSVPHDNTHTSSIPNTHNVFQHMRIKDFDLLLQRLDNSHPTTYQLINSLFKHLQVCNNSFSCRTISYINRMIRLFDGTATTTKTFLEVFTQRIKQSTAVLDGFGVLSSCSALTNLDPNASTTKEYIHAIVDKIPSDDSNGSTWTLSPSTTSTFFADTLCSLRNQNADDTDVKRLLHAYYRILSTPFVRQLPFTPDNIGFMLFGLMSFDGKDETVKGIIEILIPIIEQCKTPFTERSITLSLCGLQHLDGSDPNTDKLVVLLSKRFKSIKIPHSSYGFNARSIGKIYRGLQSLNSTASSTKFYASAIYEKIIQKVSKLSPSRFPHFTLNDIYHMVIGMHALSITDTNSNQCRMFVSECIERINVTAIVRNPHDISMSVYRLQSYHDSMTLSTRVREDIVKVLTVILTRVLDEHTRLKEIERDKEEYEKIYGMKLKDFELMKCLSGVYKIIRGDGYNNVTKGLLAVVVELVRRSSEYMTIVSDSMLLHVLQVFDMIERDSDSSNRMITILSESIASIVMRSTGLTPMTATINAAPTVHAAVPTDTAATTAIVRTANVANAVATRINQQSSKPLRIVTPGTTGRILGLLTKLPPNESSTKTLIEAIVGVLERTDVQCTMDVSDIIGSCYALYSLSTYYNSVIVNRLINMITRRIEQCSLSLDVKSIVTCIASLSTLDCNEQSVRLSLHKLIEVLLSRMKESEIDSCMLLPSCSVLSRAFVTLRLLDSSHSSSQTLLGLLTEVLSAYARDNKDEEDSEVVMTPSHMAMMLTGLDGQALTTKTIVQAIVGILEKMTLSPDDVEVWNETILSLNNLDSSDIDILKGLFYSVEN